MDRMKKIIVWVGLWMTCFSCIAQDEAVSADDNARQLQYYLQQIAANAQMIKLIRDGIQIAKFGLNAIYTIKNKEFNLHDLFFKALKAINPKIKGLGTVADILEKEANIITRYKTFFKRIKDSGQFTVAELDYMTRVYERLVDDAVSTLDELIKLISADNYQMSDDERIDRVNSLAADINSSYQFVQHFSHDALALAILRLQEKKEIDESRKIFEIK
jgi:hypothetical protein